MNNKRLIVVDDEPEFGEFVQRVAEGVGYDVKLVVKPEDFLGEYESFDPSVIVLDIVMPKIDGIELVRWLSYQQCNASIILVTGKKPFYMSAAKKMAADSGLNISSELTKPIEVNDLRAALECN